jgi:hypothetical protein
VTQVTVLGRVTSCGRSGDQEVLVQRRSLEAVAGRLLYDSPGEATLLVLRGHVRLSTPRESWEGRDGDLPMQPGRHGLEAFSDTAVLLTVARC